MVNDPVPVLWGLVDALADGVLLAQDEGVLVLANRQAEDMFGYARGELAGQPVESLVPASLRAAHLRHRAGYARQPSVRPMGARAQLAGLRKDGTTFPVRISLSPVPAATGCVIMAVVRDISEDQPRAGLTGLTLAEAPPAHAHQELLDRVVNHLYRVARSLQAAADLPHDPAMQQITDALRRLDDMIREIRDDTFGGRDHDGPPDPVPPNRSG